MQLQGLGRALALAVVFGLALAGAAAAGSARVTGTAFFRERMSLPPTAVFEALLEDVSRADAPALVLGSVVRPGPGNPPFAFAIDYDPASIDPRRRYSVRARVTVGDRLVFASDAAHPVITGGAPDQVEIPMRLVASPGSEEPPDPDRLGAHGLKLPASFAGDLPCADCEAVRYRINLWPDQVFYLRRTWLGTEAGDAVIGRWSADPEHDALVLRGADEAWRFAIPAPDRLRLLPAERTPGGPDSKYELTALPEFDAMDLNLPLRGLMTYHAGEARFMECLTGREYAISPGNDYVSLEHAYLAGGDEPGGPLMASFDGVIVGQPPTGEQAGGLPVVEVERFVGVWPGETCERAMSAASLTNTYWKIVRLGETEVPAGQGRREPHVVLRAGEPRFAATVGCNQMVGGYELDGARLTFGMAATTLMACPPMLADWERKLGGTLSATAGWRISGEVLELVDADGQPLATLRAVYLP